LADIQNIWRFGIEIFFSEYVTGVTCKMCVIWTYRFSLIFMLIGFFYVCVADADILLLLWMIFFLFILKFVLATFP